MAQVTGSGSETTIVEEAFSVTPSETDALNDLETGGQQAVEPVPAAASGPSKAPEKLGSGKRLLTLARPEWPMMWVATVALVISKSNPTQPGCREQRHLNFTMMP